MALGDSFGGALIGKPSLRRRLSGLGSNVRGALEDALSETNPRQFKSLYRQKLSQLLDNVEMAQPIDERMQIEEQLKTATGTRRDQLNEQLRRNNAGFGSAAARFSPYNYGSIAQREYGSLFRRS